MMKKIFHHLIIISKKEISAISFNGEIVKKYLLKLPNKYSSGPNKLSSMLLKKLCAFYTNSISFNISKIL